MNGEGIEFADVTRKILSGDVGLSNPFPGDGGDTGSVICEWHLVRY